MGSFMDGLFLFMIGYAAARGFVWVKNSITSSIVKKSLRSKLKSSEDLSEFHAQLGRKLRERIEVELPTLSGMSPDISSESRSSELGSLPDHCKIIESRNCGKVALLPLLRTLGEDSKTNYFVVPLSTKKRMGSFERYVVMGQLVEVSMQ